MKQKRGIFIIPLTILVSLLLANGVFAAPREITSAYTTDSSENPKTAFQWNETPYLFSTFNFWRALEKEVWISPTLNTYVFSTLDNYLSKDLDSSRQEILNTLPNWNNRKETGLWTWFARARNGSPNGQTLTGTFTITPEPVSSVLFLLGGAALFVRHNRSKRLKS